MPVDKRRKIKNIILVFSELKGLSFVQTRVYLTQGCMYQFWFYNRPYDSCEEDEMKRWKIYRPTNNLLDRWTTYK